MESERLAPQELIDAVMADFEKRGEVAIADLRKNNLSDYWRVIAEISRQELEDDDECSETQTK